MLLKDIIKNYYEHKYITFFSIVFSIILSFYISINVDKLTGRTAYLAILHFEKSFVIPPELNISESEFNFDRVENNFLDNLTSFANFKKWLDYNQFEGIELSYRNFISLKSIDKKIIISDANVDLNSNNIDLLRSYINFTIQLTNYEESKKLFYLLKNARLNLICTKISNLIEKQSGGNVNMNDVQATINKFEKLCLGPLDGDTKQTKLNKLDTDFKKFYQDSYTEIQIYNFANLAKFEKQKININNLKIINLPTITIIILILSLILQNLVITFLKRDQ
tara:strand:+ start:412 stop:1248 length:837 start_codon:yes stop_codon:yes gene_type:complete